MQESPEERITILVVNSRTFHEPGHPPMKHIPLAKLVTRLLTLAFLPVVWRVPVFALAGVAVGLGMLLVRVSEVSSYLSDHPRVCLNCHVMTPEYTTWARSSHRQVATCNDCHVPHDSLLRKYAFKAMDGLRHAAIFTLRREPQVIRALPASQQVIQENCRRCHARQLGGAAMLAHSGRRCADCHQTPHGDVQGLSTTPDVQVPHLAPILQLPSSGDTTP